MGRILLSMMSEGGGGRILPTLSPYSEIGVSGVERPDEKRKTHRKAGMGDQCVADCAEAKYPWGHDGIAVQDLQARMCGGGGGGRGRLVRKGCKSRATETEVNFVADSSR